MPSLSYISFSLLSPLSSLSRRQNPKRPVCPHTIHMDDDGLNMRNWGYYEPSFKEHLGLQLMSPIVDHRDTKPFLSSRENPIIMNPNMTPYHRSSIPSEPPNPTSLHERWLDPKRKTPPYASRKP
ncbi:unnamed protein product [Lactuca virosa]|uniref:GAGA-binding transcriptional activator n=1 Tax=Lactuca virosa TaxID=75947 RepID=A0AAU9LD60_9ASTR|nr:unnamed protein product [Lactuca virosa]